jgi:hypothetical protein
MKSPLLAFTLNFFLPGAGLWYLGKPGWGAANFFVVLAIGIAAAGLLPEEAFDKYSRYLALVCASGSGGLAQALAQQLNRDGTVQGGTSAAARRAP